MNPTQINYVKDNNLNNKKNILLKNFRIYNIIISFVLTIILIVIVQNLGLFIFFPIAVIYDSLIAPKTLFIVDKNNVHEVGNINAKIYEKKDYYIGKFVFRNKANRKYFLLLNVDKDTKNKIRRALS